MSFSTSRSMPARGYEACSASAAVFGTSRTSKSLMSIFVQQTTSKASCSRRRRAAAQFCGSTSWSLARSADTVGTKNLRAVPIRDEMFCVAEDVDVQMIPRRKASTNFGSTLTVGSAIRPNSASRCRGSPTNSASSAFSRRKFPDACLADHVLRLVHLHGVRTVEVG